MPTIVLTVHHLQASQSERIVWLCEELGLTYDLKLYQRSQFLSPLAYLALHPIGAAPVIMDGGLTLAESGAVVEHIINVYGNGKLAVKPGADNYADYLYWFHFINGTLQPAIGRNMTLQLTGLPEDNNQRVRFFAVDLSKYENILAYLGRGAGREGYRRAMGKGDPELELEDAMKGPPPEVFRALKGR